MVVSGKLKTYTKLSYITDRSEKITMRLWDMGNLEDLSDNKKALDRVLFYYLNSLSIS